MQIITYSLREDATKSDQYYRDVAMLTDEIISQGEAQCASLLNDLALFLQETKREIPRTRPEYLYEYLTLGVLWRCYIFDALDLAQIPRQALRLLTQLRERDARFKTSADCLRGLLGTLFLLPDRHRAATEPPLTLAHLDKLLEWLAATGVFEEEVKRLTNWRSFLSRQASEQVSANLSAANVFATWFEARSQQVLGSYTPNVERFLAKTHPRYRWRADAIFCGRRRVEYHLNMVGTEILNRAFRVEFLRTLRKIVLIPPCMRLQPEGKCQAQATSFGMQCAHCTPQCHVHQVTKLGEKYGLGVFILPDELSIFSTGMTQSGNRDHLGIVGVSCILTNAAGGWETKRLGVPAQGLPLDYCGCRWHWHKDGISTDINLDRLMGLLGIHQDEQPG